MARDRRSTGGRREPTAFQGAAPPPGRRQDYSLVLEVDWREAYVLVYGGPGKGAEFPLRGEQAVIGRDPIADIRIDAPTVSRRHATIVKSAEGYLLRDLGSANGTYLRGLLYLAERSLADGDYFRIGDTDLVFRDPKAETPAAGPPAGKVHFCAQRVDGEGTVASVSGGALEIAAPTVAPPVGQRLRLVLWPEGERDPVAARAEVERSEPGRLLVRFVDASPSLARILERAGGRGRG